MGDNVMTSLTEIEQSIHFVRRKKVMLDADLAALYGITVKRLNEQVRRNKVRFPADFMFQLTKEEWDSLRSQFATLEVGRGKHRKFLPYVFTEHGAVMLANVLSCKTAVEASVLVVRAFIHLRELATTHDELVRKINRMEKKYDAQFRVVFDAIRELMSPPKARRKVVGFRVGDKK